MDSPSDPLLVLQNSLLGSASLETKQYMNSIMANTDPEISDIPPKIAIAGNSWFYTATFCDRQSHALLEPVQFTRCVAPSLKLSSSVWHLRAIEEKVEIPLCPIHLIGRRYTYVVVSTSAKQAEQYTCRGNVVVLWTSLARHGSENWTGKHHRITL